MKTATLTIHCAEEDWCNLGATSKGITNQHSIEVEVHEGEETHVGLLRLNILSINDNCIRLRICGDSERELRKGENTIMRTITVGGYTDHEGCDWDGTDYDYAISWK